MNEDKASYYKQTEDGYSVFFDGREVAKGLTPEEAGQLLDDLSYYGTPMKCVFNREEICGHPYAECIACPDRNRMEAEKHG